MFLKTKITLILSFIFSANSFAITEQINHANEFLNSSSEITAIQQEIITLGTNPATQEYSDAIYYKNIGNNLEYNAISPTRDLPFKNKSHSTLLMNFQQNNGLTTTGLMDEETTALINSKQEQFQLNITEFLDPNTWFISYTQPLHWQVKTVQNSLREWENIFQKQRQNNSTKFVVVNLPNMRLTAYTWNPETETAREELISRVVIGKPIHKTPMDDMHIWGVKYNPTWTPTPNIMKRTLFKGGTLNLKWLQSHSIRVINPLGENIPYEEITEDNFGELRFIQPAGNNNALGLLKFETNSSDNIYLHDTNEKELFFHNNRSYSSGCIRVEEFLDFAVWLSENNQKTIISRIKSGQTRTLNIPMKIPVYTTYTQAYFDDKIPAFAPDVYRKNKSIIYKKP